MKEREEWTKEMINSFIKMRQEGKTIFEIAEHFNLTTAIIYYHLQEIADINGVSRDELLDRVHKPHGGRWKGRKPLEEVNVEKLATNFASMIKETDNIVSHLDGFLKKNEELVEETK